MSLLTTIYKFIKPELTDGPPDITVMNPNWDALDAELKRQDDNLIEHKAETAQDNVHGLAFKGALVRAVTQSIPNNVDTKITLYSYIQYDTSNFWSETYPDRLTVPTGVTKIKLHVGIRWAANDNGYRMIKFFKNGSGLINVPVKTILASGESADAVSTPPISVVAGDYFSVTVKQTSGGALDFLAGAENYFAMEVIE